MFLIFKIFQVCRKKNRTDLYVKVYVSNKGTLIFQYCVSMKEFSSKMQTEKMTRKYK